MKPYYRILRLNHGRAPTVQHATLKEAETEALRLAGQHPGDTFEILQVLGTARTATPVIDWNDWAEPPIQAVSLAPKPYSAPKLGEGFRYLECREVIEPGDEVWIEHRGEWIPYDPVAFGTRQHLASVGRRKLPVEPAAPAERYPTTPLPEGFDRWERRGLGWKPGREVVYTGISLDDIDYGVWFYGAARATPDGLPDMEYWEAVKDQPQYRFLQPGERIEEGDEWFDDTDDTWNPRRSTIGKPLTDKHAQTRRPIASNTPPR